MITVPERVKDALREGDRLKNYRFIVLNDDGSEDFVIDNDTLVYESVKIDERMCSGDTLKFGLCEGASLEFQYFDHPNITGRRIQSFIDVQYLDSSIKLSDTDTTYTIIDAGSYDVIVPAGSPSFDIDIYSGGYPAPSIEVSSMNMEQTITLANMAAGDKLIINSSSAVTVTLKKTDGSPWLLWHTIPMGYFTVKKCSRQASTGIQKVTAYNKLQSDYLDTNLSLAPISIPSDYIDGAIAVYGLRKNLLSKYSIDVYEKNEAKVTVASRTVPGLGVTFPSITFKFTDDSNTWYPCFTSRALNWAEIMDLSDVYLEVGDLEDFIEVLESMISYINLYLTTAGEVVNPTTLWESLKGVLYKTAGVRVGFAGASNYMYYTYDELYEWAIAAGATDARPFSEIGNLYNVQELAFFTPSVMYATKVSSYIEYRDMVQPYMPPGLDNLADILQGQVYEIAYADMEAEDLFRVPCTDIQNVTLRQIMSSSYELNCKFGQMDRVTDLFYAAELNNAALYPADTLYPLNNLYPGGISETSFRSWYSKLWTDIVGEQSFRKLTLVYRALNSDNEPEDFTLDKIVNADGTTDYEAADNWLLKNQIWTHQQVQAIADSMAERMENIRWFPFEMWAAGLPYVETGDMIEIIVGNETYTSYVLQRQLKGIHNLQDTYINGTLDVF